MPRLSTSGPPRVALRCIGLNMLTVYAKLNKRQNCDTSKGLFLMVPYKSVELSKESGPEPGLLVLLGDFMS